MARKFKIHQVGEENPVGFAYADDDLEALRVVQTWTGIAEDSEIAADAAGQPELTSDGDVYYAIDAEVRTTPYAELIRLDPTTEEFAAKVEEGWFTEMQGELLIEAGAHQDTDLRDLVERIAASGRENVLMTRDAVDQMNGRGETIPEVTPDELARRVARALAIVFYGGS